MEKPEKKKRAPGHGGRKRKSDEPRLTKSFRLDPATIDLLPAAGQSEWVEQAIREKAARAAPGPLS